MREIKFRLIYQSPNTDEPNQLLISEPLTMDDLLEHDQVDFTDGGYLRFHELEMDCIRWVEYTGLKDKNGTEIYEGDVLDFGYESRGPKYIVEHREKHTHVTEGHGQTGIDTSFGYHFDSWSPLENAEVIGNIYENPELLEAK